MAITEQSIIEYQLKKRPSIWAQYYTKIRGKPYRFEQLLPNGQLDLRRPREIPRDDKNIGLRGQRQFLQQILDDQHPWKALQKSRQCGASENEVRETLWFADVHPYTKQMYVFPTQTQVFDFSRTRIQEVMKDSPYLKMRMGIDPETGKRIKGKDDIVDSVGLRKVGDSWIFFRSGHSERAAEGTDIDCVHFDEVDRINPRAITSFNEALAASAFGWRRDVSTPTLPDVGVNYSFNQSDQRHFIMKCPKCGHWFTLLHDYPRCIVELPRDSKGQPNHNYHLKYPFIQKTDLYAYKCLKCGDLVSDETRINGVWVAWYPTRTRVRGYQISQVMCPWISAHELMMKKEDYKLEQLFMNYVLGLTYLGDNILVTKQDILRCIKTDLTNPYDLKRKNIVIGTDWGNQSWGIAGMIDPDNPEKVILLDIWMIDDKETTGDNPHIQKSAEKFRQWDATLGIYDAGYGKDRNFALNKLFPGRVYSCFYPNISVANTNRTTDQWSDNDYKVNVDRTLTLKIMAQMWRDGKFIIPQWLAQGPLFSTFIKHITNLVRIMEIEEDEKTKKEIITERIGTLPGGDHFAHALNYLLIGLRREEESGKSDFFF